MVGRGDGREAFIGFGIGAVAVWVVFQGENVELSFFFVNYY